MDRIFKVCQLLAICCLLISNTVCQPPADVANLDAIIKEIFDIPSGDANDSPPSDGSTIPPYSGAPSTDPQPTSQYPTEESQQPPQTVPQSSPQPQPQPQQPSQNPSTNEQPSTKPNGVSTHVNPDNELNVSAQK